MINKVQWEARREVYIEASEHLDQNWTDDPIEWQEGQEIAKLLRKEAAMPQ